MFIAMTYSIYTIELRTETAQGRQDSARTPKLRTMNIHVSGERSCERGTSMRSKNTYHDL